MQHLFILLQDTIMFSLQRAYYRFVLLLMLLPQRANAQKEVPVLCYHQVREWRSSDRASARAYIIPSARFRQHMQLLHDSGYHVILPDQLAGHLEKGRALPAKPVLLSFDDGTEGQYGNALPVLDQYGYKAIFFIMTVTLDRPGYLTKKQVSLLSQRGHVIGCHTWDHHDVRQYASGDWELQLTRPTRLLEDLTGKPVVYFAYPFGTWNARAIQVLKSHHYRAAFQLAGKQDPQFPLFTIRRIIASGEWTALQLDAAIKRSFKP